MTKEEALHQFWSSFGWTAYDENSVPEDAVLPYITYEVVTGKLGGTVYPTASLWDRSTSWRSVTEKGNDIARELSYGGKTIKFDDGVLFIVQGTTFTQRFADVDTTTNKEVKRLLLNLNAEFLSAD